MQSSKQHQSGKRRLKFWIAVFFLALAIPTAFLIRHAYSQLKWEAFHRHRVMAEELANRIDRRIAASIDIEQERSFGDYAFLTVSGDPTASFLQRSVLSDYPVETGSPGLIGYFQVDPDGRFSSPLLPREASSLRQYGVSDQEADRRRALQQRIFDVLDENRLVQKEEIDYRKDDSGSPVQRGRDDDGALRESWVSGESKDPEEAVLGETEEFASPSAFDRLNEPPGDRQLSKQKARTLGRVEDLKLEPGYLPEPRSVSVKPQAPKRSQTGAGRAVRKEQSALLEKKAAVADASNVPTAPLLADAVIRIFESKIDSLDFALLDSGHFVLFRNVWRDSERYVQGALIDPESFIGAVIEEEFRRTALAAASDLVVAYGGDVLAALTGQSSRGYLSRADELRGTLLFKTRLSTPLDDMELIFSITGLPVGPGGSIVFWVAVILVVVLSVGSYLMYRMGAAQIDLGRQQQDFISAVSHELKTPLTSIRMYGEMLQEGWADEDKKASYYKYISEESERLSRLISNVLQLTRLNRNDLRLELKRVGVSELMDSVRSKISSHVRSAGFDLNVNIEAAAGTAVIRVDPDAFVQIIINLVDNALKFSAAAVKKCVDIDCIRLRDGSVRFRVRDYGPGVPRDKMKKIFQLFYRSEDELTRDTIGTGIGLALVDQLAHAMGGRVDVVNKDPGAEFSMAFPAVPAPSPS